MRYNIFKTAPLRKAHRLLLVLEKSPDPMTSTLAHEARMELWASLPQEPVHPAEMNKVRARLGMPPSSSKTSAA